MLVLKSCIIQGFHSDYYISEIEKLVFVFYMLTLLGEICAGKHNGMFASQHNNYNCKFKYGYAEKCQVISEHVQYQYFSGCKSISMEVIAVDCFNIFKLSTITMARFH